MNRLLITFFVMLIFSSCEENLTKEDSSTLLQGYTDKVSYKNGELVHVFLSSIEPINDYTIAITDLKDSLIVSFQIDIKKQDLNGEPYANGFGYEESFSFELMDYPSGVYLIDDHIPFIVKPDQPKEVMILYPSNTINAYCSSGEKSAYKTLSSDGITSPVLSYQRPMSLPNYSTDFFKWIVSEKDLEIGYLCDQDMDDYKNLENSRLLIIPGHSEYWSRAGRRNFDLYIANGNDALIISGNTMWWQVRYSEDGSKMIVPKSVKNDTLVPDSLVSCKWINPMLKYPVIPSSGSQFEYGGYGMKDDNGWDGYKIVNPHTPILKSTGLEYGDVLSLPTKEYDGADLCISGDKVRLRNRFGLYRYELIGYDLASRKENSNGAWIILQRRPSSGVVINMGSTNWCHKNGIGGEHGDLIKKVTRNSIDILLNGDDPFPN